MKAVHYIETSALNLFADELHDFEFNTLYQKVMKVDLCISPVVLWEVLLNSDNSRKERLICWAQFSCVDYLLKSPAEIVIRYIQSGAPMKDRMDFYRNRATDLAIGTIWSSIHCQPDRTILTDLEKLRDQSQALRDLSRSYQKMIQSMTDESDRGNDADYFHQLMVKLREQLDAPTTQSLKNDRLTKTALILAFFIACIGVDLDNSPVQGFWQTKGIEDPFDRLEFLVTSIPRVIVRGPLMEMALMITSQLEMAGGGNRGTVFDALHSVYCYYAHNTVSSDSHFTGLAEHTGNKIYDHIVRADKYVEMMKTACKTLKTL
jgi:hypothetical protein